MRNTSASKQGEMMHTKAAPGHGELESLSPEAIIFSYRDQEKATQNEAGKQRQLF